MYTVISPKESDYAQFEHFMQSYAKYPKDLIIKEFGSTGNHPHLNIVWSDSLTKRTQDLTHFLKKHMAKANLPGLDSPVLVLTRKITDINTLIGGYLQKEENFEVLYNSGKYDLEKLREKYGRKLTNKYHWKGIVSFSTAPLQMIEYMENNEIDYLKRCKRGSLNTNSGKEHYTSDSHIVSIILMKMQRELGLQTHHLHRKTHEIHLALLAHYSVEDDLEFIF